MEDDAALKAIMRDVNRRHLHEVWLAAKAGRSRAGEEAAYAKAMLDHPEYHNAWEFADQVGAVEYVMDGANPFLHITFHVMIENQIVQQEPPEVAKTLQRLLGQGMGRLGRD